MEREKKSAKWRTNFQVHARTPPTSSSNSFGEGDERAVVGAFDVLIAYAIWLLCWCDSDSLRKTANEKKRKQRKNEPRTRKKNKKFIISDWFLWRSSVIVNIQWIYSSRKREEKILIRGAMMTMTIFDENDTDNASGGRERWRRWSIIFRLVDTTEASNRCYTLVRTHNGTNEMYIYTSFLLWT